MDFVTLAFSVIAIIVSLFALLQVERQLRQDRSAAFGNFLLNLDQMMQSHQKTHLRLRPGGEWAVTGKGPVTQEDWADVDAYMGLFERIYVLIDKKVLDAETVNRLYGYRVNNIILNQKICKAKLVINADSWTDFINLCEKLKIQIPCRNS